MTDVDIAALAKLARLEVSTEEISRLEKQLPEILAFVEQIQRVHAYVKDHVPGLHNVMRDDADPIESGRFTKKMLDAAPSREGDRVAVKQVLSKEKKK